MTLLTLIKAIMLEGRIVVFSQVSSKVSSFVYSLIALIPGLIFFNNHNGGPLPLSVLKSLRFLNQYGLPLQVFNTAEKSLCNDKTNSIG
jgi:hypothetical protein